MYKRSWKEVKGMKLINADELYTIEAHTQIGCDKIHGIQPQSAYMEMYELGWNNALKAAAKGMPEIDAAPIVRCKNCKYKEKDGLSEGVHYCDNNGLQVTDDWFCADGDEKR